MYIQNNFCPACYKEDLIDLENIDLKSQHYDYSPNDILTQNELTKAIALPLDSYQMVKCCTCGLEYSVPLVSPSSNWYSIAYKNLSLYPSERWEFNYVLEQIKPLDNIIELGSGSGIFLKKCKAYKIQSCGFDFSKDVISQCLADGLRVNLMDLSKNSNVEDITEDKKSNVIVLFHVLEHLDCPSQLFNLAWQYSQTDSELWVSVPSDRRLTRLFRERDFLDQPPHHLTRWNMSSMEIIGRNNGWNLEEIIYEPISLKQILWSYTTRNTFYKWFVNKYKNTNIWIDRIYRFSMYPFGLVSWLRARRKMTGFSMLAKYSKNINFHQKIS